MDAFELLFLGLCFIKCLFATVCFSKSESTSNYSDEAYWENRYKETKEPKKEVYEWYVSFDHISATIKEDIGKLSSGLNSLILVSGCGNSALCEDFVHKGIATKRSSCNNNYISQPR